MGHTRRSARRSPVIRVTVPLAVTLAACTMLAAAAGCTAAGSGANPTTGPTSTGPTAGATTAGAPTTTGPTTASAPGSATQSGTTTAPTGAAEQFTPIVMNVMSVPQWFTGTDGKVHLTYELELLNAFPIPATVTKVVTYDAGTGDAVQTLTGADLSSAMSMLVPQTDAVTTLPASTVGAVWMDVVLDDPAQLPQRIEHELTVDIPPGQLPVPDTTTSRGAIADVAVAPPTVLGPPLSGAGWVAVGSCCDGPHRRTVQPIDNGLWLAQRFAIDFNRVDAAGMLADGDPSRNENWFTYDQPVLAVADATVTTAVDDLPDQVPDDPRPVGIEEADGNYVILQLSEGLYAFYAHLKPGSVAVQPGDTVTKGQVIGHTGNSGSSTGTHLHFQLMDRPSALVADGRPYVFDAFTLTGRGPALADLLKLDPAKDPVPIDPAGAGERTDELPLSSDVVEFPDI